MYQLNQFTSRQLLDEKLANTVADILLSAVKTRGKATIAVSGGSTPKGFFVALSKKILPWKAITVTLADERWVDIDSPDSNTKLVYENFLQNEAALATFFHLKQGGELTSDTLNNINLAVDDHILPLDVLILGMGEDGHTASLFPCSEEINHCLALNSPSIMSVTPKTAPYQRITFSFAALAQSKNTFLHISGKNKLAVLNDAISDTDSYQMPIRAFLHADHINTHVYWAE